MMGTAVTIARPSSPFARWVDLINLRPPVAMQTALLSRFAPDSGFYHPIEDAFGDINLDLYLVQVDTLPTVKGVLLTPEALLQQMRLNINDFVDSGTAIFKPYEPKYPPNTTRDEVPWTSTTPDGAVLSIQMVDDGSVVANVSDTKRWIFSTVNTPEDGDHPVSGNREFGFFRAEAGLMFYTRGADRLTTFHHLLGAPLAFAGADFLWRSFQTKVAKFVNDNGGKAAVKTPFSERFPWGAVRILHFSPTVAKIPR